jgi:Xaa-Pro aminopeptidase
MVIALEPKFHIPGLGVIGIEDTFLVTKEGLKRITKTPQKWIKIN